MSIPANGWKRHGQGMPFYVKGGYRIHQDRPNCWVVRTPDKVQHGCHKSLTKAKAWADKHMETEQEK